MFKNMIENRKFIIGLSIALFVILVLLMVYEFRNPEAGSELLRGLFGRG